jgi:ParB family transcriptional regulator, chromosome partitioning protein
MNKKNKISERDKNLLNNLKLSFRDELKNIDSIEYIPINKIKPNPNQARKYFNDSALEELSLSIRENGVIQPILVRKNERNEIILVAGERRLRASNSIGMEKIPAIFIRGNPLEISLIENIQRENLHPLEEAEAFSQMISEFKYTQQQLSRVIGKARSTITETLSLNRLPDEIKQNCRHADIPKRTLIEVAKIKNPDKMIKFYERIAAQNLSSEKVRKITREANPENRKKAKNLIKVIRSAQTELQDLQIKNLQEKEYLQLIDELNNLRELLNNILS